MTDRERQLVDFFVRLASIPLQGEEQFGISEAFTVWNMHRAAHSTRKSDEVDFGEHWRDFNRDHSGLGALRRTELRDLEREYLRLLPEEEGLVADMLQEFGRNLEAEGLGRQGNSLANRSAWKNLNSQLRLPALHAEIRHKLAVLLDGGVVLFLADQIKGAWALQLADGRLKESPPLINFSEPLMWEFVSALRLEPFPFGRCPQCATFFVKVGRQLYCSRECSRRSIETTRKESRREYMREYMAKKREILRLSRATTGGSSARSRRGRPSG